MTTTWERFWHAEVPLRRLALFRLAVAWICLYDAFLYDPTRLVANPDQVEATWHPLVVFDLLGLDVPTPAMTANLSMAYKVSVLAVMVGFRTRTVCLLMAVLAFWQGGLFYSLTKVRHDRVALCFATFALPFSPCGGDLSIDAWLRRRRGIPAPATASRWPIALTQVTLVIGYGAAGLTKLLHWGWMNGYTLQGIVLGHRGRFADVAAANVTLCRLFSVVTVAAESLAPLCLWWPRLLWWFVPASLGFHLGTWATMDTGPYMTLWYLWVAFVPLDMVPAWWRDAWLHRPWHGIAVAAAALAVLTIIAVVVATVVPWWVALLAMVITAGVAASGQRGR